MATNGTPEQSNDAPQGGQPSGGGGFTLSGKTLIISVAALLVVVVGCNESYGDDSGSSQSSASRSEWIDDCTQVVIRRNTQTTFGGGWRPDEREQNEAETVELCECQHDYLTEYWGPDPPLISAPLDTGTDPISHSEWLAMDEDQLDKRKAQQREAYDRNREFMKMYGHAVSYCPTPSWLFR